MLLPASHSGSPPTGTDQSQLAQVAGPVLVALRGRGDAAGSLTARAYRIATPGPAPGAHPPESRMFTLERREGRAITRLRAWARAEAHQRAGVSIFGHGQGGAGALPEGWDVSSPARRRAQRAAPGRRRTPGGPCGAACTAKAPPASTDRRTARRQAPRDAPPCRRTGAPHAPPLRRSDRSTRSLYAVELGAQPRQGPPGSLGMDRGLAP